MLPLGSLKKIISTVNIPSTHQASKHSRVPQRGQKLKSAQKNVCFVQLLTLSHLEPRFRNQLKNLKKAITIEI